MKIKHRVLNFVIFEYKRIIIFIILCINIAILKRKTIKICYNTEEKLNNRNNYRAFLKDGKLYWNNETSLEINKIINEIKTHKLQQQKQKISFETIFKFRSENPKISIVITLHNQEKFIQSIYESILKQTLKDIEIIFVNDGSKDKTTFLIKRLMKKDKRIVYLKNKEKKGPFVSRNKGILNSKGDYILVIDPDDLLVNNILIKAYETAKQYNLDIIQFYALRGYYESPELWKNLKNKGGILKNNSEIRNNFYHCISRNLWDKLVRRSVYIKSINFMKKEFYNELYFINNDNTAFFGLLHSAQTFGFLEQIGYFYIFRPKGTYFYRLDPKNSNLIYRSIFNNMKYFYIQSDNNTIEKYYLSYRYFESGMKYFGKLLPYVTEGFEIYFDVFNLYLNSSFFNYNQKKKLNDFKLKFAKIEKINALKKNETINYKKFSNARKN